MSPMKALTAEAVILASWLLRLACRSPRAAGSDPVPIRRPATGPETRALPARGALGHLASCRAFGARPDVS